MHACFGLLPPLLVPTSDFSSGNGGIDPWILLHELQFGRRGHALIMDPICEVISATRRQQQAVAPRAVATSINTMQHTWESTLRHCWCA